MDSRIRTRRPRCRAWKLLTRVSLVVFAGLSIFSGCSNEPPPLHFVLITVDTLRADHLGCYGGGNPCSPRIDQLAEGGTLFVDAYTPRASTLPAVVSMLTSRYPLEHGVLGNDFRVPEAELMLAEILRDAGFRCRAFVANEVLRPGQTRVEQGFGSDQYTFISDERLMTNMALDYIRDGFGAQQREFLWVHYMNPHQPYVPPSPYDHMFDPDYVGPYDGSRACTDRIYVEKTVLTAEDREHIEAIYDGTIRFVDDLIAELLEALDATGQASETLLIFSADHGEDLYSHNCYYYHSNSIYRSSTRIPLIVRLPGRVSAGRRVDGIVELVDLLPTALGILDVSPGAIDDREHWCGIDLWPVLTGQAVGQSFAFAQWSNRIISIRDREWMYVENPGGGYPNGPPRGGTYPIAVAELYHIPSDPDEQRNVIAQNPDVASEMKGALVDLLGDFGHPAGVIERVVAREQLERLHSLGYIQ